MTSDRFPAICRHDDNPATCPECAPPRRRFRNSRDPRFQGEGWRWSLSLWLPFPLDLLVLTPEQRDACYRERVAFLDDLEREEP